MPKGDKSKYTDKQKRKAEHIEEGYEKRGVPEAEAKSRATTSVMIMKEMDKPRPARLLKRGQYDQPGDVVEPGLPKALGKLPDGLPNNRLGLAQWLVDLRRDGPHPRHVVAARLRVSNSGLARGGITEPLTTAQIDQARKTPLALVTQPKTGGGPAVVAMRESQDGIFVCTEPSVLRIDSPENKKTTVYAAKFGEPMIVSRLFAFLAAFAIAVIAGVFIGHWQTTHRLF